MKMRTKVILGVIISVLFVYSVIATSVVRDMKTANNIAAKATENKTEYYQMMAFAYSMASAIESGKYDEEQVDELYAIRAKQRNYDESLFRKCVELILDAK